MSSTWNSGSANDQDISSIGVISVSAEGETEEEEEEAAEGGVTGDEKEDEAMEEEVEAEEEAKGVEAIGETAAAGCRKPGFPQLVEAGIVGFLLCDLRCLSIVCLLWQM